MSALSPAFLEALVPILDDLAQATGLPALDPRLARDAYAVKVQGDQVLVPVRFEVHWRRFQTIPTDLIRDAAYAARRLANAEEDEADRVVFAEVFARDHILRVDD